MTPSEFGRIPTAALTVLVGVLLAAIGLYLVPALALDGRPLPAAVAVLAGAGVAGLWLLVRRELARAAGVAAAAAEQAARFGAMVAHGDQAYLILEADGGVAFASGNTGSVVGMDADRITDADTLLEQVRDRDRRRALRAFSRTRRRPGSSSIVELGGTRPDGTETFTEVRFINLMHAPAVGGILVTVRDITPRKSFENKIEHLAYYDALTGLANRRFFMEQGRKGLALARRHREPAAVFYLDLDHFKQVNDALGHEKGDEILEKVAAGLRRSLRDTDIVARMGGDEFAVVLTEVRDNDAAARVARRILDNMPATAGEDGHEIAIGASVGVSMYPEDGDSLESLLNAADLAMYRAKSEATGVEFFRPELRVHLAEQLKLEQDLKRGLERHEFQLHYQPVYHLVTGQMVGAEALSRWRHFARGMVSASEFIELAERTGLIRSLDRWAIARAVSQRARQLDDGWTGWVAVNVSRQSLDRDDLPKYVREVLDDAQLQPGSLVLELPDGVSLNQPGSSLPDLMWELKNAGAAIALDDFGRGSTSLSRLKQLPIDILKLHPEFIAGIGGDEGDEHLVDATIAIAHGIRARVLAKGVEREDQVEWLRDAGCDFLQGYLMGRPVPATDLRLPPNPELATK